MASGSHIGLNKVLKKYKNYLRIEFPIPELFSNRPIAWQLSMFSSSQADNGIESNMASSGHIGFGKCKYNPRNEFPTSILCKIDPLHKFQPFVLQKLILALNPIWRPAAILDLGHFPGSDWWGFLMVITGVLKLWNQLRNLLCDFFSTLSITMGLDWLGYKDKLWM